MALPVSGNKEEATAALSAMIKGCIPTCDTETFPADPEKACLRLGHFLKMWYQNKNISKPEERLAFKKACPNLGEHDVKQIVNSLHNYKAWLQRKKRNLKNGDRTHPIVLDLVALVSGKPETGKQNPKPEEAAPSAPLKRLKTKTKVENTEPMVSPIIVAPQFVGDDESVASKPVSGSIEEIASSSSEIVPLQDLCKFRPAAKMPPPQKKPAAKRPASQKSTKGKPAKAQKGDCWCASESFGFLKVTKACEKAYIQARDEKGKKPFCLVNVAVGRGGLQDQIMAKVLEEAKKPGLTKADLVDFKNKLLLESQGEAA